MTRKIEAPTRFNAALAVVLLITFGSLTAPWAHDTSNERASYLGSQVGAENTRLTEQQLQKKVEILEQQLEAYEVKIIETQSRLDTQQRNSSLASSRSLSNEHFTTRNFLRYKRFYDRLSETETNELAGAILTSPPLRDALLEKLTGQLDGYKQKRTKLLQGLNPKHPKVQNLETEIDKLNRRINERVSGLMSGLKARLESAKQDYHLNDRLKNVKQMRNFIHMQLMKTKLHLAVEQALKPSQNNGPTPDDVDSIEENE